MTVLLPWKCEAVQERRMPACQLPRCESYLGEERRLPLPAPLGYSAHHLIPPEWKSHIIKGTVQQDGPAEIRLIR
jgi:hypothetical protein